MEHLIYKSVTELAHAIQNRTISSREVTETCIERIKAVNPGLNAVVCLSEEKALRKADEADKVLANGHIQGPLHGIPMTIKDSLDTADMVSTGGTLGRANYIPPKDATVVARLRQAGAILVGKTNTSELTLTYDTNNLIHGQTNNPHRVSHSPGGSSGGGAAMVAAGGSPFDIGSDYGGSLRFPAHCCGVATIKPTSGRVPRTGQILPFGGLLDHFQQLGPIARNVCDLQLLLPIICGPDNIDPSIIPMPLNTGKNLDVSKLRAAFYVDNGIIPVSDETAEMIHRAAKTLQDLGLTIKEDRPEMIEETYELGMGLWSADGGALIKRLLKESNTQKHTLPWLDQADPIDAAQLDALVMKWYQYRSTMLSFFKDHDIIICPVNANPALPHGSLGPDLRAFSYTSAYNLTGWPAAVIPGGLSSKGLPMGIQIVGKPWQEDLVLATAACLEKEMDGFQPIHTLDS